MGGRSAAVPACRSETQFGGALVPAAQLDHGLADGVQGAEPVHGQGIVPCNGAGFIRAALPPSRPNRTRSVRPALPSSHPDRSLKFPASAPPRLPLAPACCYRPGRCLPISIKRLNR